MYSTEEPYEIITESITKNQEKQFEEFIEEQKKIAEEYKSNKRLMGGLTTQSENFYRSIT